MTKIGVAITTMNRPEIARETIDRWRKHLPEGAVLLVVDDASDEPLDLPPEIIRLSNPWRMGVAAAKNRGLGYLRLFLHCDHIFLADDDTYPTSDDWWKPYVESPEPHLMYNPPKLPKHWPLAETHRDEKHVAYDKGRGCLLYAERRVLDVVGGMTLAFGKHGGEHEDWSLRIHEAGLTSHPFMDVVNPSFHCLDEDGIDSSVDWRDTISWREIDRTKLPRFAELSTGIPVLVPRRPDNGHRDGLWDFLRREWWGENEGYRVTEGAHLEGPFNRSAGINIAAKAAGNWGVAIVADSDTWVPDQQLHAAVDLAYRTGKLVSALDRVVELTEEATRNVLDFGFSAIDTTGATVRTDPGLTQSSMLVVPRHLFELLGGFDERFVGWGGEDVAFWRAAELIGGGVERIPGPAYHLWHPPASTREERRSDPQYIANYRLWQRYERARTREQMREVLKR